MTSQITSELNKLKNVQQCLDSALENLDCLSKCSDDLELQQFSINLEKNRINYTETTYKKLRDIRGLIHLNSEVLQQNPNNLDLKSFKNGMICLQDDIQDLKIKLKSDLVLLQDGEKEVSEELQHYNRKLEEWEKPVKTNNILYGVHFRVNTTIPVAVNSCNKEVKEFVDFVHRSNGHENGWSSDDHQLFLKMKKKHKSLEDVVTNLQKLLPDISSDEIRKHGTWYHKYCHLKQKRDQALNDWRQNKKTAESENLLETDQSTETANRKPYNVSTKSIDNADIKEKLALWKAEKQDKRTREEQFKQDQDQRMKELQERRKRLQNELKESVEKWKQAKLLRERTEKAEKQMQECLVKKYKAAEANKMIKQFRSHDDLFVLKMRNASKRKEEQKNQVLRSKSSQMVQQPRDPERLMKPTKNWLRRTVKSDNFFKITATQVSNIKTVPKLRIPEWRQNLKQ